MQQRDVELQLLKAQLATLQDSFAQTEERLAASDEQVKHAQRRAYQYRQENHVLLGQYEAWLRAMLQPAPGNLGSAPGLAAAPSVTALRSLDLGAIHAPTAGPGGRWEGGEDRASVTAHAGGSPHVGVSYGPGPGHGMAAGGGGGAPPAPLDDRLARLIEEKRAARALRREKERARRAVDSTLGTEGEVSGVFSSGSEGEDSDLGLDAGEGVASPLALSNRGGPGRAGRGRGRGGR